MFLVVQAVRICKMRAGAAKLIGPLIHHAHEIRDGACDVLRDGVGRLVAGGDHQAVEQVVERQLLADLKPGGAAVAVKTGERALVDRDDIGEVAVFQRQQAGHDLGQTGRIDALVDIFLIDRAASVHIDQNGRLGIDLKRPVGDILLCVVFGQNADAAHAQKDKQ